MDKDLRLLSLENQRLREWISELEAFLGETTKHFMPQSNWGRLKKRLLAKRPEFLK